VLIKIVLVFATIHEQHPSVPLSFLTKEKGLLPSAEGRRDVI